MYPGRIKAGVTFRLSQEFITLAPADVVRRVAAKHAGELLTELLLNPEADPFTDLQLRAERLVADDFRLDAETWRVQLSCAITPKQYVPIATPIYPPEYIADAPLWAPKELE